MRFAIPALIAVMGTFGTGCAQLLGYTDITAVDGSVEDTTSDGGLVQDTASNDADTPGDGGLVQDTAGDEADTGNDRLSTDAIANDSSNDSQDGTDATSCSGDLSNVHAGNFLISFTIQTNQPDNFIGLVNQRNVCVGAGLFWDAMLVNQHVRLELSESTDNSRYVSLVSSGGPLNDNNRHDVVVTRTSDVVKMMIDGQLAGSKTMDQNLGSLPPLRIGNGVCPGVVTIRETIANVCVRPN
jgi:hypothetical protein